LIEPQLVKPVDILLVEDNPSEAELVHEALASDKLDKRLHVVGDGEKAMAFLRRQGCYAEAPRPELILLDLNLPCKDGHEVLAEVKTDKVLRRIPVVVLTSSQDQGDVLRTYSLHGNCYVIKPADLDEFFHVVRSIADFWLSIVALPSDEMLR